MEHTIWVIYYKGKPATNVANRGYAKESTARGRATAIARGRGLKEDDFTVVPYEASKDIVQTVTITEDDFKGIVEETNFWYGCPECGVWVVYQDIFCSKCDCKFEWVVKESE